MYAIYTRTYSEYEAWKAVNNNGKGWNMKYYKGLGMRLLCFLFDPAPVRSPLRPTFADRVDPSMNPLLFRTCSKRCFGSDGRQPSPLACVTTIEGGSQMASYLPKFIGNAACGITNATRSDRGWGSQPSSLLIVWHSSEPVSPRRLDILMHKPTL